MGYKKLSQEEELQLVEDYRNGVSVKSLMAKYGYKTKKSITDKVKKYYPDEYKEIVQKAHDNRKSYNYSFEKIENSFDAYFLGLLLTDGYILTNSDGVGLDLTDEDAIQFIAQTLNTNYNSYEQKEEERKTRHRIVIQYKGAREHLKRYGVIPNKSAIIPKPQLLEEEEIYLPYLIRGIIDGDGCVAQTSYGGAQFYIVTMSEEFADWIVDVLTKKFFMKDIHKRLTTAGLWRIETADQFNILKLIAIVYNQPFGMSRKYNSLRKTFRDYNRDALLVD